MLSTTFSLGIVPILKPVWMMPTPSSRTTRSICRITVSGEPQSTVPRSMRSSIVSSRWAARWAMRRSRATGVL